jgi:hypothetical protein
MGLRQLRGLRNARALFRLIAMIQVCHRGRFYYRRYIQAA